jgi:nucleoside-diphosphate-sugar epimerase
MTKTVLITGASGKVGQHAGRVFAQRGWTVRQYRRGTDMTEAALGCEVIVNGMNPPDYHNWAEEIPRITRLHIAAARASGARVVIPGNVYNYGDDASGLWSAQTPQRACSRKGRIRVEMEQAYRESGVRVLVLRAGNFIDPERADHAHRQLHRSDHVFDIGGVEPRVVQRGLICNCVPCGLR